MVFHHSLLLTASVEVDDDLSNVAVLSRQILSEELDCKPGDIADFELSVCDVQASCIGGARNDFKFSGRLDNLASSYCALRGLVDSCKNPADLAEESSIRVVALFDNEEVSAQLKNCDCSFGLNI